MTLTGPGRHRQDAPRARGRRGARARRRPARFVDLSPLRDPELVGPTIAQALELPRRGDDRRAARLAVAAPRPRQLRAAARRGAVRRGAARGGAGLRVLATSRAPLRLSAEHEYPVPPLPPDDAVALFAARARAVDPTSRSPEQRWPRSASGSTACRSRSSWPRRASKLLPPERDGRPPRALARAPDRRRARPARPPADAARRRSTGATSCSSPPAQALFAQLAVFRGGWTLEAAEAVAGRDVVGRARRARRREPRPASRRAVHDARDDSRVRVAPARRGHQAPARGALPRARRGRGRRPRRPEP